MMKILLPFLAFIFGIKAERSSLRIIIKEKHVPVRPSVPSLNYRQQMADICATESFRVGPDKGIWHSS
jgi:hypothetical protein